MSIKLLSEISFLNSVAMGVGGIVGIVINNFRKFSFAWYNLYTDVINEISNQNVYQNVSLRLTIQQ